MNIVNILENPLINTDSYKISQWKFYRPEAGNMFSYIESRGGEYPFHIFFGLQMYIKSFLSKKITREMVEQAKEFIDKHMGQNIFNYNGFIKIVEKHNGSWPVIIKAVPEGSKIHTKNVLLTIESIDPEFNWVPSFLETSLLRAVWAPTVVATISYNMRETVKKYLEETADNFNSLDFSVLNFGARGVSSQESDQILSAAHLLSFKGSDSLNGVATVMKYYDSEMPGFSVSATEHSIMTQYLPVEELECFKNILNLVSDNSIISIVADTYNCFEVAHKLNKLSHIVKEKNLTLVFRFDSGIPNGVIPPVIETLKTGYEYFINSKGYIEFKNLKFLWGDGINPNNIHEILDIFKNMKVSTSMIMQGCGGGLLQNHVQRDAGGKWAMKASAMHYRNNLWVDIFKNPITDPGKVSKKGRITLVKNSTDIVTKRITDVLDTDVELLQTVYANGPLVNSFENFETIRERVNRL